MRRWFELAALALVALAALPAAAQDFPSRTLRLIVPFPPGGIMDTLGRVTAQGMGELLGQTVVVDNRGGANGAIGTEATVNATPDGYTFLLGAASTQVLNPLVNKFSYEPIEALAPIGMIAETALLLVVHPGVPVQTVPELIAWLKANPARANFGSYGEASASHLAGELFKQTTGVAMTHVPYKGVAAAQTDLMGGEIALLFSDMSAIPHVRSGKLRALAVTGSRRSAVLPELPTVAETGLAGYEVGGWFALFAPAATPAPALGKLREALAQFVVQPATRDRLQGFGLDLTTTTVDQLGPRMRAERAKWAKVIAEAGIKTN